MTVGSSSVRRCRSGLVRRRGMLAGAGVVCAVAASVIGMGVSAAAPSSFADQQTTKRTDDGWVVSAVKSHEQVRSVPPLNLDPPMSLGLERVS